MEKDAVQLSWSGVVVINCTLVNSTPAIQPCYFLVPRNGYLGQHTNTVTQSFSPHIKDVPDPQLWFSFETQPIPWHVPIGVILDRIAARKGITDPMTLMPLPLIAHFNNFPHDKIIRFRDPKAATSYYSHTIKAAMTIMFGSHSDSYGRLSPRSYSQVTDCMSQNDAEGFVNTTTKIRQTAGKSVIKYPFIIYHEGGSSFSGIDAAEVEGSTFGQFLRKHATVLFGSMTDEDCVAECPGPNLAFIQSTLPMMCTPLLWICENMCCADHFVHVVLGAGSPVKQIVM